MTKLEAALLDMAAFLDERRLSVDLILAALPYESAALRRAVAVELGGQTEGRGRG